MVSSDLILGFNYPVTFRLREQSPKIYLIASRGQITKKTDFQQ